MTESHEEFQLLKPSEVEADIPSEELVRSLPKVDLHCHSDGLLRLETIGNWPRIVR